MDAIFDRSSIRRFEDREVEEDKINRILRAGMAAPSGGNQQPWEFFVVRDKEITKRLSQSSPYAGSAANATVVIVPCFKSQGLIYPELIDMDMSACIENMLVEITALGLGGVWLSIAPYNDRMSNVGEILGIGDKLKAFALIPVGYPSGSIRRTDRYEEERIHYI